MIKQKDLEIKRLLKELAQAKKQQATTEHQHTVYDLKSTITLL
jgi:hypothetical protein